MASYFKEGEVKATDEESLGCFYKIRKFFQAINDKAQFYQKQRWIAIGILVLFYFIRLFITRGYHALSYCIGIHFLNSFIGFISPMIDPEEEGNNTEDDSYLPQKQNEEFRPFQRKIREYQFWQALFFTLFIANIITFYPAFDVQVYWPLLLVYFILIFFLTMRNQISHMIKYQYLPWDFGKVQYNQGIPGAPVGL